MSVLINGTNGLIQAYDYQTPATGFSYTFAAGTQTLVMNPAATLATGTITMPAAPSDGMTITISSSKQITALTLNGNTGQTVVGAVSYLPANTAVAYVYRSANTSWFPTQAVPLLEAQPIGYGQVWTNVTGSRVFGTTYTNSTGRPIQLAITLYSTNSNAVPQLSINGTVVYVSNNAVSTNGYNSINGAIVPNGATYAVTNNYLTSTMQYWFELR